MTREEFTIGFDRLCRGHRLEPTEERAEATFRTVRHWSALAWQEAVDVLLVEPRFPDRTRLIAAVDAAGDRLRQRSRPEPYLPERIPAGTPDRDYGQARLDLVKLLVRGKIGKRDLAERLFALADRFPAMADTLVREAAWFADRAAGIGPPLNAEPGVRPESPPEAPTPPSASQAPQERFDLSTGAP